MRSSSILTLLGATLAVATPLAHEHLHKKAIVYDIVTDIVYVTVTEGAVPSTSAPPTTVRVQHTVYVNPIEASSTSSKVKPTFSKKPTSTYVPPPPPTTSTTPPPAPTTTTEAPAPTTEAPAPTTEAPAPVATTTQAPVVEVAPTTSAAPVATTAAATTSDDSLSGTGITNHNTCRSSHSAEDVTWNSTLADAAQKLANTCVWGHDLTIDGGGYGQNIASQGSSSSDAWTLESALENAIIDEWYSEASIFAALYGQESPQQSGGDWTHFTQIVWKNSLEIGCAVAACPESNSIFPGMYTWYTVCNYYPQGNVLGEFAQNVASS